MNTVPIDTSVYLQNKHSSHVTAAGVADMFCGLV